MGACKPSADIILRISNAHQLRKLHLRADPMIDHKREAGASLPLTSTSVPHFPKWLSHLHLMAHLLISGYWPDVLKKAYKTNKTTIKKKP